MSEDSDTLSALFGQPETYDDPGGSIQVSEAHETNREDVPGLARVRCSLETARRRGNWGGSTRTHEDRHGLRGNLGSVVGEVGMAVLGTAAGHARASPRGKRPFL